MVVEVWWSLRSGGVSVLGGTSCGPGVHGVCRFCRCRCTFVFFKNPKSTNKKLFLLFYLFFKKIKRPTFGVWPNSPAVRKAWPGGAILRP